MISGLKRFGSLLRSKPSGFQKLPWNVIEQIIAYVQVMHLASLRPRATVDDSTYLKPLFHVCQNWRSVAMKIACRQCFISYNPLHSDLYVDISNWPLFVPQPNPVTWDCVSKVIITADSWSIYNGQLLECFLRSSYKDAVFNAAYNLQIIFKSNNKKLGEDAHVYKNAYEFVAFVKQMVPNVVTVEVNNNCKYIANDDITCMLGNRLMENLLSIGSNKVLEHGVSYSLVAIYPQPLSGLTSIKCDWDENCDIIRELICNNHKSLKHLSVLSDVVVEIELLLMTETNSFITYPQLRELKLVKCTHADFMKRASDSYVPFPSLKLLDISAFDEFPDYLLQATVKHLRCLKMTINDTIAQGLLLSNLVADNHANLKYVELRSSDKRLEMYSPCTDAIIDVAMALGTAANILVLSGFKIAPSTLLHNLIGVKMKSIKMLDLHSFDVDFDALVALLKAFANLQHLRCRHIHLGNNYEGKKLINLLNDMVAKYHPLNTDLRFITTRSRLYDAESMVRSALVIALLCRNLKKITVDKDNVQYYNDAMNKLVYENNLEKHLISSVSFPLFFA
ncbi:hypothetical protein BX667DRAFT_520277 [Coemansia mojavensis]|nr:hypothetical protein BX667DRAFT_520277 [Coemansia mojavensis]